MLEATPRTTISPDDFSRLFALTMTCPVRQDNPPDCPLFEVRKLSLNQRWAWAKSRTREEAENILVYHATACQRRK